ncbi:MAG TPA: acetoin utilization protein AcuC, partial [Deinococcales bacterium]|nr:acetoin utilization protein AcuC [Deinococcales bacterium]
MNGGKPEPVAFVYTPDFQRYVLRAGHPFSPARVEATRSLAQALGLGGLAEVRPRPATWEELRSAHSEAYLQALRAASDGKAVRRLEDYGLGTPDTPVSPGIFEASAITAGGTLSAAREILSGRYRKAVNLAGGLHHAQRDRAAGFCTVSDLSVAAREFTRAGWRVAYLDVDAHHGDGVQWLHYDDPNVMTISWHETGRHLFPGTGFTYELGRGHGIGTALNVPLEPYTGDASFLSAVDRVLEPALAWFRPDVILLQAGADAHRLDPLADLNLTRQGFARVFERIVQAADRYTAGRLLATGGGGYATFHVVPRVWATLLAALTGQDLPPRSPEQWLEAWRPRSEEPIPAPMDDPPEPGAREVEIGLANERTVDRLLHDWRTV